MTNATTATRWTCGNCFLIADMGSVPATIADVRRVMRVHNTHGAAWRVGQPCIPGKRHSWTPVR